MIQSKATINYSVSRAEATTSQFKQFNDFVISELSSLYGGLRYAKQEGVWSSEGFEFGKSKYSDLTYESGILIEICSIESAELMLQKIKTTLNLGCETQEVNIDWVNVEFSAVDCQHFQIKK
ncbi:MAG: hypothetical protein JKX82_04950 [Oleispira sp.]|nr:hypothetical protein [Oleispira sp.]